MKAVVHLSRLGKLAQLDLALTYIQSGHFGSTEDWINKYRLAFIYMNLQAIPQTNVEMY